MLGKFIMRIRYSFLLAATCLFAQAPTAQETKPAVSPDTVVASVNGKAYTAADIDAIVNGLPQAQKTVFHRDPKAFLQQYLEMQAILQKAEKQDLGGKLPCKEQLEELERQTQFYRKQILLQAALNDYSSKIPAGTVEMKALYDKDPEKYREATVKVIYVPFSSTPSPKGSSALKEEEAKMRAEAVAEDARKGTDFVKLVKDNSQDKESLARDGDFGMPIRANTERVPADVKRALLEAKAGEIAGPFRGPNGYYVFKVQSAGIPPFDALQDELHKGLQSQGISKWLAGLRDENTLKVENEDYFKK